MKITSMQKILKTLFIIGIYTFICIFSTGKCQADVKYLIKADDEECGEKKRVFIRPDLPASTQIFGKIVDESGKPVPNIFINLYKNTHYDKFPLFGYTVGKSDARGCFFFRDVMPGEYIAGINLAESPTFNIPYPLTFYPKGKTIKEAQIIKVNGEELLRLQPIILPHKLKTVVITGKLVWADGSPVRDLWKSKYGVQKRVLHALDPIIRLTVSSSLTSGGEGEALIDETGNFSFSVFEGYSYIIHAHAYNKDNLPFHVRHFQITAKKNMKPLTLKLSIPGDGRGREIEDEEINSKK